MRAAILLIAGCLWLGACGGSVTGSEGRKSADGGTMSGGATGAGGARPGCPAIPTVPEYGCKNRSPAPDDCGPWHSPDGGIQQIGYPQGCSVTLPTPDVFSNGCGPQVCSCSMFPMADGTMKPDWVCPV